ncbi:hypothetical protein BD626DRAFT_523619 [Schizophyllum amplum]|uniref:Uncharacterized protein n=2 Tax=Schizophyllum amplum TaxID=97359 RepID=A0A550BT11_9AGAR|nr:hypothetical protein BD626DRAFT_523619 [Auriculariopsis ampla]
MASLALACTAGVVARTLTPSQPSEPTLQPTAPRARRRGSSTYDHVTAACPSAPKFNNCAGPTTRGAVRPRCHLGLIMTVVCRFESCGRPARMSVRRREVCCAPFWENNGTMGRSFGAIVDLPVNSRLVRVK